MELRSPCLIPLSMINSSVTNPSKTIQVLLSLSMACMKVTSHVGYFSWCMLSKSWEVTALGKALVMSKRIIVTTFF